MAERSLELDSIELAAAIFGSGDQNIHLLEKEFRVTAVCPAGVATDLYGLTPRWQRIGTRLGVLITADSCARRGLRALWRGRRCIVPDWWNRVWIPLCKMLPMWVLRPVRRFTMKFQK